MSGASTPSNQGQSFSGETVTTATVNYVGTTVTLPTVPADVSLYQVLIVNHGPWPVRLASVTGPQGTMPVSGIEVPPSTSRLLTDPLLTTATSYGLVVLVGGGVSTVDVWRGMVNTTPQLPSFSITGP